jgi:hypothetical protein
MVQEVREEFQAVKKKSILLQCPQRHESLKFTAMSTGVHH